MSVRVPAACRSGVRDCPTIFEMAGYENASAEGLTTTGEFGGEDAPLSRDSRQLTEIFDGDYATVHASVAARAAPAASSICSACAARATARG